MKLEKKITLGEGKVTGTLCQELECIVDTKMLTSDADIIIGAYTKAQGFTNQYGNLELKNTTDNYFTGMVSSVEIFSDAFTKKQILKLYEQDKNHYQKNTTIDSVSIGSESPALSDSECLDLAKERGLEAQLDGTYTLVCQFPFNVVIPLNSSVLWMETLPLNVGPYHSMRSVDDLFRTGFATFAVMDFYKPDFTYGAYEYFDELNKSLTGKIIITKQLEQKKLDSIKDCIKGTLSTELCSMEHIKISRHSAAPDCGKDDSCYEPFAVSVDVRAEVIWRNEDSFTHTITSGTPDDGPDGVFDSGLLPPMRYFSHTFSAAGADDYSLWRGEGIYDYYCIVHPWMKGMIVVGEI